MTFDQRRHVKEQIDLYVRSRLHDPFPGDWALDKDLFPARTRTSPDEQRRRKLAWNRDYKRRQRAGFAAQGLTARGTPRKRPA